MSIQGLIKCDRCGIGEGFGNFPTKERFGFIKGMYEIPLPKGWKSIFNEKVICKKCIEEYNKLINNFNKG